MSGAMKGDNGKPVQAGGSILALSIILGAVGGVLAGQPSIGFLLGLVVGLAVALLLWLRGRG